MFPDMVRKVRGATLPLYAAEELYPDVFGFDRHQLQPWFRSRLFPRMCISILYFNFRSRSYELRSVEPTKSRNRFNEKAKFVLRNGSSHMSVFITIDHLSTDVARINVTKGI